MNIYGKWYSNTYLGIADWVWGEYCRF